MQTREISIRSILSLPLVVTLLAVSFIPAVAFSQSAASLSEAELDAQTANSISDIRRISNEIISNYLEIGQQLGLQEVADKGELARQRLDSMANFIESVVNKLSPPDNAIFGDWKNIPSPKSFFNRFLNLFLEPLRSWRNRTRELKNFFSNINSADSATRLNKQFTSSLATSDALPSPEFYEDIVCEWIRGWSREERDFFWMQIRLMNAQIAALGDICGQDIVVGGGGNVGIFKAFMQVPKFMSDAVSYYVAACVSNIGASRIKANLERLGHVHGDLEVLQDTSDQVITSLRQHRVDFAEWTALSMRTRIEVNLAGHGNHPHPIALFQLPKQFGGYLELARDIVAETIGDMTAAGERVWKADKWLVKGDEEFAAGSYKSAYRLYAKAYRDATRVGGGDNDDDDGDDHGDGD